MRLSQYRRRKPYSWFRIALYIAALILVLLIMWKSESVVRFFLRMR